MKTTSLFGKTFGLLAGALLLSFATPALADNSAPGHSAPVAADSGHDGDPLEGIHLDSGVGEDKPKKGRRAPAPQKNRRAPAPKA